MSRSCEVGRSIVWEVALRAHSRTGAAADPEFWAVGALAGCDLLQLATKSSYTTERAKVEQMLETQSDGYRFVAYVVTTLSFTLTEP